MRLGKQRVKFNPLIETATRFFGQEGFDGTTTLEIAKAVGVVEPLIYYYFPTKSEFYAYVATRAHSRYRRLLVELPETGGPWERIEALVKAHHRFAQKQVFEAILVTRPVPGSLESGRVWLEKSASSIRTALKRRLSANLRDGVADGSFAKVEVAATTNLLTLMLFRLLELSADSKMKGADDALLAFLKRGLEERHEMHGLADGLVSRQQ